MIFSYLRAKIFGIALARLFEEFEKSFINLARCEYSIGDRYREIHYICLQDGRGSEKLVVLYDCLIQANWSIRYLRTNILPPSWDGSYYVTATGWGKCKMANCVKVV
jgi:hypothetical protein